MGRVFTAAVVLLASGVLLVAVAGAAGPKPGTTDESGTEQAEPPTQLEQLVERLPQRRGRLPEIIPAPGVAGSQACDDPVPPPLRGGRLPPSLEGPVPLSPSAGKDCIEYPPEGCSLLVEGSGPVGSCEQPDGGRQLPPGVKRITAPTD